MNNREFLDAISRSFKKFLETSSRSNEKLKVLHGAIASDIFEKLKRLSGFSKISGRFDVASLGFRKGKESKILGRYIDKTVDITIIDKSRNIAVAGIAVKFVMQNYLQNSNNYFENMLGETANIRCKGVPYFQIFIIPDKIPYYDKDGRIQKWESFSDINTRKYEVLARDNPDSYFHTPNKTLLYVVHVPDTDERIVSKKDYVRVYSSLASLNVKETLLPYHVLREHRESTVIFNDYEMFIDKICYAILAR